MLLRWCCALLVSVVVVVGLPCLPVGAEGGYAPPVDAPVVEVFRPPPGPYGPGNRGIDYGAPPGSPVVAAGDGEVVFAGPVGGARHVVVLHPDGLRTSYSFLATVAVRRGDRVARGDVVGAAGPVPLHFGVRAGERYLDPAALLAGTAPVVHLVPVKGTEDEERSWLARMWQGAGRVTGAAVEWVRDDIAASVEYVQGTIESYVALFEVVEHYVWLPRNVLLHVWRGRLLLLAQLDCTPASEPPPARPPGRRILLLVGGFGSEAGGAAVLDLDTEALGYADGDVAQFSYRGGQAPGRRHLEGVATSGYDHEDSAGDIRESAERFAAFVEEVRAANPGVPIDVVAHSQGGLVVRQSQVRVDHVVTLGTPHHGADLATANAGVGESDSGATAQLVAEQFGFDATSIAASQLAETSDFIRDLPPPTGDVTSIGAQGDWIVPSAQTLLDGATNATVSLRGTSAHDRLPGSPEAAREVALALADAGPTCRNVLGDLAYGTAVSVVEDVLGAALVAASQRLDAKLPGPTRKAEVPPTGGTR